MTALNSCSVALRVHTSDEVVSGIVMVVMIGAPSLATDMVIVSPQVPVTPRVLADAAPAEMMDNAALSGATTNNRPRTLFNRIQLTAFGQKV
ncbi:MAG TPA: hypothetical protein VGG05_26785 [Pseudonocardiaceae bacterium]